MTKLYSRMFPVILILIFEITIATAALTNVWAAVAFYTQKGGSASQDEMYYVAVNDYTDRDIEYQEYLDSAKKSVKAFFDEMSKSDCEIWVYPVAVEAAEGDNVLCRLYLGTKEDSEYFNQVKGVYVGNDIKYYCKNNKIKIYSEEFDISEKDWSEAYEKIYKYFPGVTVMGWVCGVYMWNSKVDATINIIQRKYFSKESNILFLFDLSTLSF